MVGEQILEMKMKFNNFKEFEKNDIVILKVNNLSFKAVILNKKKNILELLPMFNFDKEQSPYVSRMKVSYDSISECRKIDKKDINGLYYLIGISNKKISKAVQKYFNGEAKKNADI